MSKDMRAFSNSRMKEEAKQSSNHTYQGYYGDNLESARERAMNLFIAGNKAFYKKTRKKGFDVYHVYSFS